MKGWIRPLWLGIVGLTLCGLGIVVFMRVFPPHDLCHAHGIHVPARFEIALHPSGTAIWVLSFDKQAMQRMSSDLVIKPDGSLSMSSCGKSMMDKAVSSSLRLKEWRCPQGWRYDAIHLNDAGGINFIGECSHPVTPERM
jgi:hypothetical protein